jgi:hypothetical protein
MKKQHNNFWNSCPLKLEYLPDQPCLTGKQSLDTPQNASCEWFINSEEDNYCFWSYVRRLSTEDGSFSPITQSKIGSLLKIPHAKISEEVQKALDNLRNSKEFKELLKEEFS